MVGKADRTNGHFVFVSYSHKDGDRYVYEQIRQLQEAGIRVWYDDGMYSGEKWYAQVWQQLSRQNCIGTIFFVSESFLRSPACQKEAQYVIQRNGKHYAVVNLMQTDISDMIQSLLNTRNSDGVCMDEAYQEPFRRLFHQDVIYRSPTTQPNENTTEDLLSHMDRWGYDGNAELFPCSNVLHDGHIEYLPALLRFTPFSYTLFLASTEKQFVADSLNSLNVFEQDWKEYLIEDASKEQYPETEGGVVLIVKERNMDLLCEALSQYVGQVPLLVVFSAEELSEAEQMLGNAQDTIAAWRKQQGVPEAQADKLAPYLAVQTDQKNLVQSVLLPALEDVSCADACRLMLSSGRFFSQKVAWYLERDMMWEPIQWLMFQEPLNGRDEDALQELKSDLGLPCQHSRSAFHHQKVQDIMVPEIG